MSIRPQSSSHRPVLPLTIEVSVNDQVFIGDYAPGKVITQIRNDDLTTTNDLTLRVNCLVRSGTPNTGLVDTPVRIWDESLGGEVVIGGTEISPAGMKIESFVVTGSDSGTVNITLW